MAKLYVTEFVTAGRDPGSGVPVGHGGSWLENPASPIAIGGGALNSASFGTNTSLIRVNCDAVCSIVIGTSPSATINNARMAANQTEYFAVVPGQQISVISNI